MKKPLLIILLIFSFMHNASSQDETSMVYNLSLGASNPAFNILDLSPSKIERPSDPNEFAFLLQSASDNFTLIPRNYSMEISSWIFHPKVDYANFNSKNNIGRNIYQSFTLSLGTTTDTSSNTTRLGTGIKFSILRGNIKSVAGISEEYKNKLISLNENSASFMNEERGKDVEFSNLKKQYESLIAVRPMTPEVTAKIRDLEKKMEDRGKIVDIESNAKIKIREAELLKELDEEAKKIQFVRDGFKLDFVSAVAFNFAEQDFDMGKFSKAAGWLVFGNEWVTNRNFSTSLLGITKGVFINDSTTDGDVKTFGTEAYFEGGVRVIQQISQLTLSGEILWSNKFTPSYLVDIGYNAGDNKIILFSFGKEQGGNPYNTGSLIAAINFLIGLGSRRPADF